MGYLIFTRGKKVGHNLTRHSAEVSKYLSYTQGNIWLNITNNKPNITYYSNMTIYFQFYTEFLFIFAASISFSDPLLPLDFLKTDIIARDAPLTADNSIYSSHCSFPWIQRSVHPQHLESRCYRLTVKVGLLLQTGSQGRTVATY